MENVCLIGGRRPRSELKHSPAGQAPTEHRSRSLWERALLANGALAAAPVFHAAQHIFHKGGVKLVAEVFVFHR